jgi:YD repeat-containing protein
VAASILFAAPARAQRDFFYDTAGRLRQVTYDDGTTVLFKYDLAGRVSSYKVLDSPPAVGGGSSSKKCFIATATYGSPSEQHVVALRAFRDEYLITNAPGRALVDLYYATSPPLAELIAEHESLRALARLHLDPIVYAAAFPRRALAALLLAGLLTIACTRRRERRAAA